MRNLKTTPTETDYKNRKIEGLEEKQMLLLPNDEITIKLKVKKTTLLRMWLEEINIEIAKTENTINL